MSEDLKSASAAAYTAAADHFDDPALGFWDRFGRRSVERLALLPGEAVLDACCGTGASALPAAEQVGPSGRVVGVDVAEASLSLARAKAERRGLTNVEFIAGDVEATGLPSASFDAVVCVFGIFFLPDMTRLMQELWRMVRPGGRLAITIWGPHLFEPAVGMFWDAVRAERPDLVGKFHPWTRVTSSEALAGLFDDAGIGGARIVVEPGQHALTTPDDWWLIVLGSGYRATVDALAPDAAERVRAATLASVRALDIRSITTDVIYAVAPKATA